IVEAAAQILAREGEAALTTARIAERAGVSVGSIYQHFADKDAITETLIDEQRRDIAASITRELEAASGLDVETTARRIIGALIETFRQRRGARRLILKAVMRRALEGGQGAVGPVGAAIAAAAVRAGRPMTPAQVHVLTRAINHTLRDAMLADDPMLDDPEFEVELVRLAVSYLAACESAAKAGA
ncbi:MAG: TetR/AcrR family transcriptional regulator; helix-turn-helix transcriptional regulator, partial [Parvularculaceae bacterium]|nr:TetR/AcrR family transcriptional regulator; helix-turn-helix transcriptional regulator [Parvularculaceae bacterium]